MKHTIRKQWALVGSVAAGLLFAFAGIADAAPIALISCPFGSSATACTPNGGSPGGGVENEGTTALYYWGDYALRLEFENVVGNFDIGVTNEEISQDSEVMDARLALFPNQVCVPIADGSNICVVFHFSGDTTPSETTWNGDWTATIFWLADTNADYPGSTVRVLHELGADTDNTFDTDVTFGEYCASECGFPSPPPCVGDGCPIIVLAPSIDDPAIGGRDDNFQSIMVTSELTPVPEPASMLLVGAGLGSLLYRRRRMKKSA